MTAHPSMIVFYKSLLCPRCMLVRRELAKLRREYPEFEVEEVDVALSPLRAWRSGIRMIPALRAGDDLLAGILLAPEDIRRFVALHLERAAQTGRKTP